MLRDFDYNHLKSSYICREVVSARIRKASKTDPVAEICGDSILINLGRKVFAIADGPDWNKSSASEFLKQFNRLMQGLPFKQNYKNNGLIEYLGINFIKNVNKLINETHYTSPTTFSCLIIIPAKDSLKCLILHCGDSCIYMVNTREKKVSLSTKTNFNFVGRTRKLSQVEYISIDSETRFLLCSDGIHALTRGSKKIDHLIMSCFEKNEIDSIPNALLESDNVNDICDDISVIALNPNLLQGSFENHTLIL